MTGSGDGEHVIEGHRDIGDDDHLHGCPEGISTRVVFVFMVFRGTDLAVELPDDIEEEDGSEELEAWDLQEKDDTEREDDTQDRSTRDSPEDRFFPSSSLELLRSHPDEDRVITAHHEVDDDDIEESKGSCTREDMSEVAHK